LQAPALETHDRRWAIVRRWLIAVVLASGCVDAAAPEAPATVKIVPHEAATTSARAPEQPATDVCALAAELPGTNICSLMCEPDVMKEQLIADGMTMGSCYEFVCNLPDASTVTVGVCLPPAPP
jgi:hypothetical protein